MPATSPQRTSIYTSHLGRRWARVMLAGMVALAGALSGCTAKPHVQAEPTASAGVSTSPPPKGVWTAPIRAIERPQAARNGFVFTAFTDGKFEVVSLAAPDGAVRWRAPASPSMVDPEEGVHAVVMAEGGLVLWLEPGADYAKGQVWVTVADSVTGKQKWRYGDGRIGVTEQPYVCETSEQVCFSERTSSGQRRFVTLEVSTGKVIERFAYSPGPATGRRALAPECGRTLAAYLCETGNGLASWSESGSFVWVKSYRQLFGSLAVDAKFGATVSLRDGRFVGSLGRVIPAASGLTNTHDLSSLWVTFALDRKTGRVLWTQPDATVACGDLVFNPGHPVRCRWTGTATWSDQKTEFSSLAVHLEGFDPATGKATWQRDVGAVERLALSGPRKRDVIRLGEDVYVLSSPAGVVTLDIGIGPRDDEAARTGWCPFEDHLTLATAVNGERTFAGTGYFRCGFDGRPSGDPPSIPTWAGDSSGRTFVWLDEDGHPHAFPAV